MSRLVWDQSGERVYETGVRQGVLYPIAEDGTYPVGVPWNGLTSVTESPSGAEANPFFADDIKYLNIMSAEDFGGTIEAYTYPKEFGACNGEATLVEGVSIGQQARKPFGFSYRTTIGNDTMGDNYGYKLHLVYCALASPSEKTNSTINENPEPAAMSWEFSTTPVNVTGHKPTAHLTVDSTKVSKEKMAALEAVLYGSESTEARMPLPDEVASIIGGAA